MKASEILREALELLDGGRRWTKKRWYRRDPRTGQRVEFCSVGAVNHALDERGLVRTHRAQRFLGMALHEELGVAEPLVVFNDHPETEWSDVERMFKRAIHNAEEEEASGMA